MEREKVGRNGAGERKNSANLAWRAGASGALQTSVREGTRGDTANRNRGRRGEKKGNTAWGEPIRPPETWRKRGKKRKLSESHGKQRKKATITANKVRKVPPGEESLNSCERTHARSGLLNIIRRYGGGKRR